MQSLREIFDQHQGRLLNKWESYLEVYETFFSKYRDKEIVFLEIGVAHGGSLQMWRKFFGEKALLIGVDVNPECKQFEEKNTKIFIGSQEDKKFLNYLKSQVPKLDILLDDGGHTMKQQITTFNVLFNHVKDDGIYVCEDLHTSYFRNYGGGYKKESSFIEFSKNFIDNLHGWHKEIDNKDKMFNQLTKSVFGLHYYDSILLIEKRTMKEPKNLFIGKEQLKYHFQDFGQKKSLIKRLELFLKGIKRKWGSKLCVYRSHFFDNFRQYDKSCSF